MGNKYPWRGFGKEPTYPQKIWVPDNNIGICKMMASNWKQTSLAQLPDMSNDTELSSRVLPHCVLLPNVATLGRHSEAEERIFSGFLELKTYRIPHKSSIRNSRKRLSVLVPEVRLLESNTH